MFNSHDSDGKEKNTRNSQFFRNTHREAPGFIGDYKPEQLNQLDSFSFPIGDVTQRVEVYVSKGEDVQKAQSIVEKIRKVMQKVQTGISALPEIKQNLHEVPLVIVIGRSQGNTANSSGQLKTYDSKNVMFLDTDSAEFLDTSLPHEMLHHVFDLAFGLSQDLLLEEMPTLSYIQCFMDGSISNSKEILKRLLADLKKSPAYRQMKGLPGLFARNKPFTLDELRGNEKYKTLKQNKESEAQAKEIEDAFLYLSSAALASILLGMKSSEDVIVSIYKTAREYETRTNRKLPKEKLSYLRSEWSSILMTALNITKEKADEILKKAENLIWA